MSDNAEDVIPVTVLVRAHNPDYLFREGYDEWPVLDPAMCFGYYAMVDSER